MVPISVYHEIDRFQIPLDNQKKRPCGIGNMHSKNSELENLKFRWFNEIKWA